MRFQRELVTVVDDLRLDTLLRMLKTPHFSTKMNSLKEVSPKPGHTPVFGGKRFLISSAHLLSGDKADRGEYSF